MIEIQASPVIAFFAYKDAAALLAEYGEESALAGLPVPKPHEPTYLQLEANAGFHLIVALDKGELIGFATILIYLNPHYSTKLAVTESLFVRRPKRKTGAGIQLIKCCEEIAQAAGAAGLLVSAPMEGSLGRVLENRGTFRETNRVFLRSFV